ncbi:hypothetical protein DLD77_08140 [Chitinophaga alhagiae]|uniref:Zinc-finger domain-containing protein n=1 Tax=Chitinophaga alhagiae TaxID=2203219 RepID=A0ABM6WCR3_9BACT|nr:hypothetical protein [Chitinophaga alhagiae]AWO01667.1 hypothetical protein DLD77_08140 [Chitinophaga alhagiae]
MSTDIHISNYEEFLYSYVDGELNAAEIAALEAFLDAHPHLRQELELLMATRLVPEKELVFDARASLYRSSTVNLQNYEPFLLSYIDGELSGEETAAVEQFAAAHPAVQKELEIWKATRLQPDLNIRFEHKAALYRHTTTVRRMRPAYWWAAAAAVVAGAVFFLLPGTDRPVNQPPVAVVTPTPQAGEQNAPQQQQQPAAQDVATGPAGQSAASAGKDLAQAAPAGKDVTHPAPARVPAARQSADRAATRALAQQTPPAAEATPERPQQETTLAANTPSVEKETAQQQPPVALAGIVTEHRAKPEPPAELAAVPKKMPETNAPAVANRPPSLEPQRDVALATAPPPGELIMSVTGNGIESKVLDKVTNVARLFSRKRNK